MTIKELKEIKEHLSNLFIDLDYEVFQEELKASPVSQLTSPDDMILQNAQLNAMRTCRGILTCRIRNLQKEIEELENEKKDS